jgi:MICOS complex subunit MIC19
VQTDSTRARNLELQIQSRVTAELERLAAEAQKSLSSTLASATSPSSTQDASSSSPSLLDKAKDAVTPGSSQPNKADQRSHDSVQKEIADLKQKLEQRKKIEKEDSRVEKAKEELVACLRTNDRRPLDCWQEVETFKREVGRMEKAFVEGSMR